VNKIKKLRIFVPLALCIILVMASTVAKLRLAGAIANAAYKRPSHPSTNKENQKFVIAKNQI
jgi:hypothetical protein